MWKVIDISGDGYKICVKDNSLYATKDGEEKLKVHFSDINSIICYGNQIVYTNDLFQKCIEYKVPLIICDKTYMPTGLFLSSFRNIEYGARVRIQIEAKLPNKKRAWKNIIESKLYNQALVLDKYNKTLEAKQLFEYAKEVKSADSDNREAQGARVYFSSIFNNNFTREKANTDILNASLNYGYTVLRGIIARCVVSHGLNPAIGLFHSYKHNPFCLVDDLIEPIRPIVDMKIKDNYQIFVTEQILTTNLKKYLVGILQDNLFFEDGAYSLLAGVSKYILSYIDFISENTDKIIVPKIINNDIKV